MDQKTNPISIKQTPMNVPKPKIIVVGLGGGGCNAVNRMIEFGVKVSNSSHAIPINKLFKVL